ARKSGLPSRSRYRHGLACRTREKRQTVRREREERSVSEGKRSSPLAAAIMGGVIGSVLTSAALFLAAPAVLSSKIVRQGLLADPKILPDAVDALRDAQYAPVLAANRAALETPFGSSWKGAPKPQVTLIEFYDYACPYCKASNPTVDRLLSEDHGLRVVYRELP